jgi:hypothetical protein
MLNYRFTALPLYRFTALPLYRFTAGTAALLHSRQMLDN